MGKIKRLISVILSVVLLVSSIFVGGVVASATGLSDLYTTINTYDDEGITFNAYDDLDGHLASSISNADGEVMYEGKKPLYFSAYGAQVQSSPEGQGNAVHFVEAASSEVYYYPIVRVYTDSNNKLPHYAPLANTTYEVSLKYYVAKDPSKEIQLQVRRSAWEELDYYQGNSDIGSEVVIASITKATDGWAEAHITYTTSENPQFMSIGLVSANKGAASNVDVWVDDIEVNECLQVKAYNYNAVSDSFVPASKNTTVADIEIPEVAGYRFCGIYKDAEYETKLSSSALIGELAEIYFKWEPLTVGQYYCGFEDYTPQIASMSYDTKVAVITDEAAYVGSKALKATLAANGITAFELRNEAPFEIVKDTPYTVTFAYKADAAVEVYAGLAKAEDVTGTAYAVSEKLAATVNGDWQTATLDITPDKCTAEGYAIAMLLYTEVGATVYIDDVLVSCVNAKTTNPDINTGFTPDWYPNLAVFEGIEVPEIWDGTVATEFAGGTGTEEDPYQISNGAQLAYAITSGGTIDGTEACSFVLTDDIYLNDVDKITWSTGVVADGYTVHSWYNYSENFSGTIDGDGHTVYGMYRDENPSSMTSWADFGAALVPKVADGDSVTIINLGVDNAYIEVECGASAFVATSRGTVTVDKCYAGANVYLNGGDAGAFVGHCGADKTVFISDSYSLATTNGKDNKGLVGNANMTALTVNNCYNANGPIVSYNGSHYSTNIKVSSSYETVASAKGTGDARYTFTDVAVLTTANMQGTNVFDEGKMPNLNTASAYTATETYPILSVFLDEAALETETDPEIWDGSVATEFAGGTGTEEDPYQISNGAQLAYAITSGGTIDEIEGCSFILTDDIYLNNVDMVNWLSGTVDGDYKVKAWFTSDEVKHNAENTSYKTFAGNIDGDGHTVYGLYVKNPNSYSGSTNWATGLIPHAAGAVTVKNLGIDNAYLSYEGPSSAFVGTSDSGATVTIDSCYAGKDVLLDGTYTAAFRAATNNCSVPTTVTNSYSLASLSPHNGTYGLIGVAWGTTVIKNSYNANGPIASTTESITTVTNCYQTANSVDSRAVTITAENMKGEDVLEADGKMPLLNADKAFVTTSLDFADHDYYVYLPEGTVLTEDFKPTFFDTFFMSLDSDKVMYGKTMKRGAYVKFAVEPVAESILIPSELEYLVQEGAMLDIVNSTAYTNYFGKDLEIVTKQLSDQPGDAVNYIFITDTHYDNGWNTSRGQDPVIIKQMELIAKIANENDNIDFVVLGGDITNGAFANGEVTDPKETHIGAMQKVLNPLLECEKPVFVLMGNHDDGAWGRYFSMDYMISDMEWNVNILQKYSPADIKHDSNDTNSKYYYYDLEKVVNGETKTTRIVCLDSIDYDHVYDPETGAITELNLNDGYAASDADSASKYLTGYSYWGYSPAQLQWLASVLSEEDKFDDVIFLSHMGIDETTYPNACTIHYSAEMRALISAYQQKTSYTNTEMGIVVDYSETTGKILSYQFGHTHMELTLYSEDVDMWQINTSTSNKEQNTADPTKAYKQAWNILDQALGNDSEACFDIMSVTKSGILKLNVGAGNSARLINPVKTAGDVNMDSAVDICDLVKLHNAASETAKTTAADVDRNNILAVDADAEALRRLLIGKK